MMKVLDNININQTEYTCIQVLLIDGKNVYKLYNMTDDKSIYVIDNENTYEEVKNKELLEKINSITEAKADIIVKNN